MRRIPFLCGKKRCKTMKIAILGTENSHAYAFAKLIKENPKFADLEVIGVYGPEEPQNKKLLEDGLTPHVADRPDAYVDEADAVMVVARHGDLHYDYALPYIRKGMPAFIDKPFCVDMSKVDALIEEAKKSGSLLCGGSCLKYLDELKPLQRYAADKKVLGGYIAAPVNMDNPYAGFYFYAQHLIEMLIPVFGADVKSVHAYCPDTMKNRLSVIFHYDNYDVHAQYTDCYSYSATVVTDQSIMHAVCDNVAYCYEPEVEVFANMLRSGKMHYSFEDLRRPVELLHCIEEAYLTGKEVKA